MADADDLAITALNALASSHDGWMDLHHLEAHLETRLGSTDEEARDSQSSQSRDFAESFGQLVSAKVGSGSIVDRSLARLDGGRIQVTGPGRSYVGR